MHHLSAGRNSPRLANSARTLRGSEAGCAGVDERRAVALLVDLLKVNDQRAWIVLGICEDFGSEQRNDVVRNDLARFVLEVRVIDPEVRVEPVDLVRDELTRDESLSD